MLDSKLLRKDPEEVEKRLKTKDPSIHLGPILALDERSRHIILEVEEFKAKRNQLSKQIGEKKRLKEDVTSLMQEVEMFGSRIDILDKERQAVEEALQSALSHLPNLPKE